MKSTHQLFIVVIFFSISNLFAQIEVSHEFGFTTGPVTMQSDYGERHHLPSSTSTSFGIAAVHYLNFYGSNYNWRNGASFFSDHFKLKSEVSYYFNNSLEHKGRYVEASSGLETQKLRDMKGKTKSLNFGTGLEFHFKNLEDYGLLFNDNVRFAPYVGLGLQYNIFTPEVTSDGGDWVTDPTVLPQKWQNNVYVEKDNTFSLTMSAGTRYKLNKFDLVLDARWQYFFTDKYDGLDAPVTENKFNDTLIYFSFGVVFNMESFSNNY